jgi:serine/threonine protein kinase
VSSSHDAEVLGIIHRDLKPANVKVRDDGTVKVFDFALAKILEPVGTTSSLSQSPTITTRAMTQVGVMLGTAAYMSPEQAKGRAAHRATGCVLIATRRRALRSTPRCWLRRSMHAAEHNTCRAAPSSQNSSSIVAVRQPTNRSRRE